MKVGGGDTAQDNSGGTGACLPPAKHTSTITTHDHDDSFYDDHDQ